MKLTDVIRRPLVTEKTTIAREEGDGRGVRGGARGDEDRRASSAVEKLFGVEGGRRCARRSCTASSSARAASRDSVRTGRRPGSGCKAGEKVPEFIEGSVEDASCRFASTSRRRRPAVPERADVRRDHDVDAAQAADRDRSSDRAAATTSGELTSWWRGGGHKRNYRVIDFKRDKFNIPGKVATVEYDPNRSARIALVTYADGEKRYILHPLGPEGRRPGDVGRERRHPAGQLPAAQEHSARHDDPQRRAEAGQGRPDRAVGRVVRAAGGEGRPATRR